MIAQNLHCRKTRLQINKVRREQQRHSEEMRKRWESRSSKLLRIKMVRKIVAGARAEDVSPPLPRPVSLGADSPQPEPHKERGFSAGGKGSLLEAPESPTYFLHFGKPPPRAQAAPTEPQAREGQGALPALHTC